MNNYYFTKSANYLKQLSLAFVVMIFSVSSYAGLTDLSEIVSATVFTKNDCNSANAYFEDDAGDCQILIRSTDDNSIVATTGAYETIKFDTSVVNNGTVGDTTFSNLTSDNKTGSWSSYPGIKFWIAKSATYAKIFWWVDKTEISNGTCFSQDDTSVNAKTANLNIECMNLAQVVTSGTWSTPGKNGGQGLSHLTFFGGIEACTENCSGNTVVPEPSAILLFALGLLGFVGYRKKIS